MLRGLLGGDQALPASASIMTPALSAATAISTTTTATSSVIGTGRWGVESRGVTMGSSSRVSVRRANLPRPTECLR